MDTPYKSFYYVSSNFINDDVHVSQSIEIKYFYLHYTVVQIEIILFQCFTECPLCFRLCNYWKILMLYVLIMLNMLIQQFSTKKSQCTIIKPPINVCHIFTGLPQFQQCTQILTLFCTKSSWLNSSSLWSVIDPRTTTDDIFSKYISNYVILHFT